MREKRAPALRREPHTELLGDVTVERPLRKELAGRCRSRREQMLGKELRGRPVGLDETLTTPRLLPTTLPPTFLVAQGDTDTAGEILDRLGEAQPVDLLDEADDVATLAAPEAVPATDLRPHVERRGAFVMERAQALVRANTSRLESDVRADDLLDACALADGVDILALDQPGHAASLVGRGAEQTCLRRAGLLRPHVRVRMQAPRAAHATLRPTRR